MTIRNIESSTKLLSLAVAFYERYCL